MEPTEWDSIMQLVSDGLAQDTATADKPSSRPSLVRSVSTTQVPTPPHSQLSTPKDEDQDQATVVSVSTTFFPGANLDALPTDLVVLSSDSVFFYVHAHKLLEASQNGFNAQIKGQRKLGPDDPAPIVSLPHDSSVVNVLLHTIYHHSASHYSPPPEAVITAVEALHTYGLPAATYLAPATPLFALVLASAPSAPIEFYALAAALDNYSLAVPISAHLLSYSLSGLTDELAQRIGPIYLKRLFFLHLGRVEALKRLLLPPPQPHAPSAACDFTEQKKLTRAWALASAYLAWDARCDLSTSAIESALRPLGHYLTCDQCRGLLDERIDHLVAKWSLVKVSISPLSLARG
ncbi:hypothetical protein FA95DRAFT_1526398 [Auriscalpium vulgare]|uniref:Uncharacterized protein n=1 Tax=Auriscalpium vulgare TaxID=40419 RepID=A0ACB8RBX4_9AGAM|nr:hypothetical protein FA95DRAFT_1526398 [Auriscalpium vulgare]